MIYCIKKNYYRVGSKGPDDFDKIITIDFFLLHSTINEKGELERKNRDDSLANVLLYKVEELLSDLQTRKMLSFEKLLQPNMY